MLRRPTAAASIAGTAALLGLLASIGPATAAADPITLNEASTTIPSRPVKSPPAHNGTIAVCPDSHPKLTGGGASLSTSDNPDIQLWSTDLVEEAVWGGTASNTETGHGTQLTVTALCAKRGKFASREAGKDGDFGLQVAEAVNCPPGKKLTGGGVDGTPVSVSRKRRGGVPPPEITTTKPADGPDANSKRDDRWIGAVGSGNVNVKAVCARHAGTFKYVRSDSLPLPASGAGFAHARCPVGAEVTGGGVDTTALNLGIEIVDSSPDASGEHQGWRGFATNSTSEEEDIQAFAICRL